MMNTKTRLAISLAAIITPAFFAAGCSSTPNQSDTADRYHVSRSAESPAPQSTKPADAMVVADSAADTTIESTPENKISEENRLIDGLISSSESLPADEPAVDEPEPGVMAEIAATLEDIPEPESGTDERPALTLFRFGFDKKELSEKDKAIVIQHGEFLAQHPEKKIQLHGHADAQGDPAYNRYLATQRANHVAELLQAQGVSKAQIEIFSWGSDKPQASAGSWKDHRRVELFYEESLMVDAGEDPTKKTAL